MIRATSLLGVAAAFIGCSSDGPASFGKGTPVDASTSAPNAPSDASLSVGATIRPTIRRTSFGIPHIIADSYLAAGAGLGYAEAQDGVCIIADQVLKVRGERAKYLGAGSGNANIESDLTYLGLALRARAEMAYAQQSRNMRDLVDGFAAGYNEYLRRTSADELPAPCRGAKWVKPITGKDLMAYTSDLCLLAGLRPLLSYVANAQPPGQSTGSAAPAEGLPSFRELSFGSNGWAIGEDRSGNGKAMLLANPHFPWEGELRFYESQLTIPGTLDVYGSAILGVPAITIGFNRHVAWTHTVAASGHFTAYQLVLAQDDPTTYMYDGQPRKMARASYTIEVLQPDGSTQRVSRTYWRSHYGPLLSGPGMSWTNGLAYTVRDANEFDVRAGEQWLAMDAAKNLADLEAADVAEHGLPWVNTIETSDEGRARYIDASRVPNLSAQTVSAYQTAISRDPVTQGLAQNGIVLLDGSTSRDEWVGIGDPSIEGLVQAGDAPALTRSDFVMNANDVATYANPAAPIRSLPIMYGNANQPPTARTHMNLRLLTEGGDRRFTPSDLIDGILGNRSWTAEQLLALVVQRCKATSAVNVEGSAVDIRDACSALESWNGRFDLEQGGAVVWRELLGQYSAAERRDKGPLYAQPFDPDHPLDTPSGLAAAPVLGPDPLLVSLGKVVMAMKNAGIAVSAPLGTVQWAQKGDIRIPIHGGQGNLEGTVNAITYGTTNSTLLPRTVRGPLLSPGTGGLTANGYPVNYGTSFMMVVEFDDSGPRASALLTYSESTDPSSPYFADETKLFSAKRVRPVLYREADIEADPNLRKTTLEIRNPND